MNAINYINIFLEEINFKELDLDSMYDKFNKELFDSKLPKIPVVQSSLKHIGGKAEAIRTAKGLIIPTRIVMSNMFKRNDLKEVEAILVHEMIHIFLYTQGIDYDIGGTGGHGVNFKSKVSDIQKKIGFSIPLIDDVKEISDQIKNKEVDIVVKYDKDNKNVTLVSVFKRGVLTSDVIKDNSEYLSEWGRDIYIIQSNNREFLKYPHQIKFRKIQWYILKPDIAKEILKSDKIIHKIPSGKSEKKYDV